ncbi:MAG TPA: hypothetical protein VHS54_05485, partial [Jatrophihabitans sp.]|nr:hypothetical protein [Jatrophihabitans sp.]
TVHRTLQRRSRPPTATPSTVTKRATTQPCRGPGREVLDPGLAHARMTALRDPVIRTNRPQP